MENITVHGFEDNNKGENKGEKRNNIEKLQLQKRRLRRKRPSKRWKKCNPVRKKKRQL